MLNSFKILAENSSKLKKQLNHSWAKVEPFSSTQMHLLTFFAFTLLVTWLTYYSLREMFAVGFLTVLFGMLLWPLYKKINTILPGPRLLASFITIVLTIIMIVIPLFLVGRMLFGQFVALAGMFDINQVQQTLTGLVERFNSLVSPIPVIGSYLVLDYTAVANTIVGFLGAISSSVVGLIYLSGQSALKFFIDFFLITALLFYALPDMDKLYQWLVDNSPFSRYATKLYLKRSHSMILDVIRGSLVVSFVQAVLSAIFLVILQVPAAGIIAILVFFLSLLPILGSGIVLVPVSIYYMVTGHWFMGLAILIWQVMVVASVDNVLRPVLVSDDSHIHPALMLLAVAGGIASLGMMGLLYGPLLMILFLTTIEVYNKEFKAKR